jgi:RNA polymerase sigma factor (sigma-70 family)
MRDDPAVTALVTRARHGDQQAWDALVERYAPLVWSICRRHRLARADTDDVGQAVWLLLVTHLDQLREPAALPGWLATTTARECGKARRAARPAHTARCDLDAGAIPDPGADPADSGLLAAERHAALRQAFTCLPPACQQLLALLIEDPPLPYAQISARLGIPAGSIGPTRRRCLHKLRRHPAHRRPDRRRTPGHRTQAARASGTSTSGSSVQWALSGHTSGAGRAFAPGPAAILAVRHWRRPIIREERS